MSMGLAPRSRLCLAVSWATTAGRMMWRSETYCRTVSLSGARLVRHTSEVVSGRGPKIDPLRCL